MAIISYQESFINAINKIILNFIQGPTPVEEPGFSAWNWLSGDSGAQPPQVNEWMDGQFPSGMKGDSTSTTPTTTNWAAWTTGMNDSLDGAPEDVRKWCIKTYETAGEDPPTVPDEVINWTKGHLPSGVTVVVRKGQGVKR